MSMCASLVSLASMLCAMQVWVEPPMVKVYPDTQGPSNWASEDARLYAAQGEFESFQICVRANRDTLRGVHIEPRELNRHIGPPQIWNVGYIEAPSRFERSVGQGAWYPDPLLPHAPVDIEPETTRVFWITFEVPRDIRPAVHSGRVRIRYDSRRVRTLDTRIEVFGFELQRPPALKSLFSLNHAALARLYAIDSTAIDEWAPQYELLTAYPFSFNLLEGAAPILPHPGSSAMLFDRLREHLATVATQAGFGSIALSPVDGGLEPFPLPPDPAAPDPLQSYLLEAAQYLDGHGWTERACYEFTPSASRDGWDALKRNSFRVLRAHPGVKRLVSAPLHPELEAYVDLWAVVPGRVHPGAVHRLRAGESLRTHPPIKGAASASSGAGTRRRPSDFPPEDAFDGSPFTWWRSDSAPGPGPRKQWLQLDFAAPTHIDKLYLVWAPGLDAGEILVQTSADGRFFSSATTRWEHYVALRPGEFAHAEGTLRFPQRAAALRLEFTSTRAGGPVGVAVASIEPPVTPGRRSAERPVEVWLRAAQGGFPSWRADAHPVEARLLPWLCWDLAATGIRGNHLNQWPEAWLRAGGGAHEGWSGGGAGEGFLLYPGPEGPMPSIRLELLRDGFEDYAYLQALGEAVQRGVIGGSLADWSRRRPVNLEPQMDDLTAWTERILDTRIAVGRALSQLAPAR